MKIILSPARHMKTTAANKPETAPLFQEDTAYLLKKLKCIDPWQLQALLKTNEKLALEAFANYQAMDLKPDAWLCGTPAAFTYNGLVYKHLSPDSFSEATLAYAKEHLYIPSAFYGCLRPMDGIFPYRLEMTNKFKPDGHSLYRFWADKIHRQVFEDREPVVNLASAEYALMIRRHLKPEDLWIDVIFLTYHKGRLRTIVTEAKAMRGLMARSILENQIEDPGRLRELSFNGYTYEPCLSSQNKLVYVNT